MNSTQILELNVGGHAYTTTKSTLCSLNKDSYLAKLCNESFGKCVDRDGRVFIDRDGKYFGHVLNFLRNNELIIEACPILCKLLLKEAEYYGIASLEEQLLDMIREIEKAEKARKAVEEPPLCDTMMRRILSRAELYPLDKCPTEPVPHRRRRSISSPTAVEMRDMISKITIDPYLFNTEIEF